MLCLGLAALSMADGLQAAVPVSESVPDTAAPVGGLVQPQSAEALDGRKDRYSDASDDALWAPAGVGPAADLPEGGSLQQLFYRLQGVQQELQILRGEVEEQRYQLEQLQQQQRNQYLDLDRRVSALSPNRPAPGPVSDAAQEAPQPAEEARKPKVPASEKEVYASAIELMRARAFDQSAIAFESVIVNYPNGQYTPNAFYWLGELYLAMADQERARQNFVQVLRLYPDHEKVPDALYKLGVLYHGLGDVEQARRYLARVQSEHPQSSAATLAKKYAAEIL